MTNSLADRFIAALHKLEASGDVSEMASLFTPDGEIGNVIVPDKFHGPDGARVFWTKYRETFAEMESSFRTQVFAETGAALEWTTKGTTSNGHSIEYEGVTMLEFAGDKIKRFRAYFDPAALTEQVASANA